MIDSICPFFQILPSCVNAEWVNSLIEGLQIRKKSMVAWASIPLKVVPVGGDPLWSNGELVLGVPVAFRIVDIVTPVGTALKRL